MDWQLIWEKMQVLALRFYNFTMTQGENNFMLVNKELLYGEDVPTEVAVFFIASFVVMILTAIFASDSFQLWHPIEELTEWGKKISIIKVVIFAAAVFSIHTFYKTLVAIVGGVIYADASVRALVCLGSFINPFAIMIYAYAVSTLELQKKYVQAAFLGWAIFLTPAAMSFYGFTYEHIAIYAAAGAIGFMGGILYRRLSPFMTCFILYIVYFIAKYFMIRYSDVVQLLTATTTPGKIKQYLACVQMDLILALIMLLVLWGYKLAVSEKVKLVRDGVFVGIFAAVTVVASVFSVTELTYQPEYEQAVKLWENKKYEDAWYAFDALNGYKDSEDYIEQCKKELEVPTYNKALKLMDQDKYEEAIEKLQMIEGYKNSSELIEMCTRILRNKLVGVWQSSNGSVLTLRGDGTCYFMLSSGGFSEGVWDVDEEWKISVKPEILNYEIYAVAEQTYHTTSFLMESSNHEWEDETFDKLPEFSNAPEHVLKLVGTWYGSAGSALTLYEDGTCYYVDGGGAEGSGTWEVDENAVLRVQNEVLSYPIYALLRQGCDTTLMGVVSVSSDWNDETFEKQ